MTVTGLAEEADFLFDDSGTPRAIEFGNALQMWALCQHRDVTVREAALAFNATEAVIRQAVEEHYWMFLLGDKIEHDGE